MRVGDNVYLVENVVSPGRNEVLRRLFKAKTGGHLKN